MSVELHMFIFLKCFEGIINVIEFVESLVVRRVVFFSSHSTGGTFRSFSLKFFNRPAEYCVHKRNFFATKICDRDLQGRSDGVVYLCTQLQLTQLFLTCLPLFLKLSYAVTCQNIFPCTVIGHKTQLTYVMLICQNA